MRRQSGPAGPAATDARGETVATPPPPLMHSLTTERRDVSQDRSQPGRHAFGVALVALAGIVVIAAAGLLGGVPAATIAVWGVLATFAIYAASEAVGWAVQVFAGVDRPLERMLVSMMVRGLLAAAVLIVAVLGLKVEPRVAALVALPMYLSLVASEIASALTEWRKQKDTADASTADAGEKDR